MVKSQPGVEQYFIYGSVLAVLALGAFYLSGPMQSVERRNLDIARAGLKDPSSAQFDEVQTVSAMTCGLVNSKNSFGAYAGRSLFFVEGGVAYYDGDAMMRANVNSSVCSTEATIFALQQATRSLL